MKLQSSECPFWVFNIYFYGLYNIKCTVAHYTAPLKIEQLTWNLGWNSQSISFGCQNSHLNQSDSSDLRRRSSPCRRNDPFCLPAPYYSDYSKWNHLIIKTILWITCNIWPFWRNENKNNNQGASHAHKLKISIMIVSKNEAPRKVRKMKITVKRLINARSQIEARELTRKS